MRSFFSLLIFFFFSSSSACRALLSQLSREEFQCVTKKDAKETYLLAEGTIAILKFVERNNPHHSSWTKVSIGPAISSVLDWQFAFWCVSVLCIFFCYVFFCFLMNLVEIVCRPHP